MQGIEEKESISGAQEIGILGRKECCLENRTSSESSHKSRKHIEGHNGHEYFMECGKQRGKSLSTCHVPKLIFSSVQFSHLVVAPLYTLHRMPGVLSITNSWQYPRLCLIQAWIIQPSHPHVPFLLPQSSCTESLFQ